MHILTISKGGIKMIRKLAFLEIVVKEDLDRMLKWYTQILGFEIFGEKVENEDGAWCQLATKTGDTQLSLWKPSFQWFNQNKKTVTCIPVFEVDDLDATVLELTIKGVMFCENTRRRRKYRITTLLDPENNKLQLYEFLA
jgi:hypothetical protein